MDVILIQPRHKVNRIPSRRSQLPLGLLTLATPLDQAGYQVRIINQNIEPDWEDSLLAELKTRPVCVGVTAMTGPQIWWGLKASEIVKRNSDVPVVWGGIHPSLLPQQTLKNPHVDIVVQGEGEETFFELVRALANKQSLDTIKGIWYKESGVIKQNPLRPFIDLNLQPLVSYNLVDLTKHPNKVLGIECLRFETSRGCPFNCTFCYNAIFNHRQWRAISAEQTLLRMKYLKGKYNVQGVSFRDDNFFTNLDRAYQIMEGMVQQQLNIAWDKGDIRLDSLAKMDDAFLNLIERSGCLSLAIGIESGSQRMADLLRKGIDVSQAISANKRLARYRMRVRYYFLVGTPGEIESDLAETASLLLKLIDENPKSLGRVHIFIPYPGTELFDIAVQLGLAVPQKLEDWVTFSWSNRQLNYPWLSPEMKSMVKMLSFCGLFIAKGRRRKVASEISPLISLMATLYNPIARSRVAGLHYKYLPELKIAELLGFRGF